MSWFASLAMDVVHEDCVPILVGPRSALVDHRTGVRMPTARIARAAVASVRRSANIVPVVGNRLNIGVCVRIKMLARLPLISGALNHVIQVRDDAGRAKRLAMVIEINAPRIAGALGKNFEHVSCRMIAQRPALIGTRSAFGVPGLPTFECVNTPWQP